MSIARQILLSLFLVVVVGGGWILYQRPAFVFGAVEESGESSRPAGSAAGGPGGPGGGQGNPRPGGFGQTLVVTAPVGTDDSGTEVRSIGTAAAARSVTLFPQVSGIVASVDFTPGTEVTGGQVLLRLDSEDQQVALDRATIALDAARESLDRAERLEKTGNVTASALSDTRLAVQQAEIDVRMAELDLAKRTIRAPFDGVIGLTDVSVGDLISSQSAIATVADMSSVTVAFDIPERIVGQIAVGEDVTATAAALPGVTISGRVSAIDNRIDTATRTMRVEATLPNDSAALKPGMAITTDLSVEGETRPSVPSLAIQWDRDGSFVWKLDGETVHRTPVQIVSRRSGTVTIAGDIEPGDEVVVEGVLRLREGMTVVKVGDTAAPEVAPGAEPQGEEPGAVSGPGPASAPRAAAKMREAG
jgi:RND family efflux transporter MFP subunit